MKYFIAIALLSVLGISQTFGENKSIPGDWLLTKVESANGPQEVYTPVTFGKNGDFVVMGMKMGTWKNDKKSKVISIVSEQFREISGENRILKFDNDFMVLENKGAKMYFQRMDKVKIESENKNSGLMGAWKLSSEKPDVERIIKFTPPDNFSYVEKEPGMETSGNGTWVYDQKKNSLLLIARIEGLAKKYSLSDKSEKGFTMKSEKAVIKAVNVPAASKVERLSFNKDDFYGADGSFKYDDDNKLSPQWLDAHEMMQYLTNVHQLTYQYRLLNEATGVFITKNLVSDVKADEANQSISIDYVFSGRDKNNVSHDEQLTSNKIKPEQNYNKLFPEKEMNFRVTGQETITVPAGTFHCTVIEALGDFDEYRKLWMIDDKPGVYARIIADKPGDFGSYSVYELQEIK